LSPSKYVTLFAPHLLHIRSQQCQL
jgi:hypothetical protein